MKNIYLLICLFLATSFYAQTSLFSPNDRQEILSENLYENEIKASHLVLNTDAFLSESISFNPFDNEPIIIDKNNSVSGNSWVGKIRNQQFGYFIISESKGIYFGKAVLDSGKIMMIRHQKNNTYRVSEISPDSVNIDEDCEAVAQLTDRDDTPDDEQVDQDYGPDVCDTSVTCSDVVMDVLVVYSDALLTAQGSAATIEAAVQSAITEANLTLSNSQQDGTNHTFNVVAIEEINFLEDSSGSANLSALRADETVIDLRNRHSADLVALILNGGSCGIGNVNSDNLGFQSTAGHSVTRWSCMTGNLTLTHEMGHNIGFRHNRYSDTSNAGICDYGYGYVNENAASSTDQRWRTAMAYNAECSAQGFNCTRLTYFSNPDVTIGTAADPAGKAIGDAEAANNAEVLERSACHVAQFRTAATCTDCILYQNCENYATDFDSGPGNSLQIDISDTFASVVSAGTVEICLNLFGDNSGTSEQFSVITEDGTTVGTTSLGRDCEFPTRTCFTISSADYNNFIADGTISITIDPTDTGVNPSLCSQNMACVEVLVENAVLSSDTITINNAIKVYPNPTSSLINIETLSNIETITIYSNIGKKIKTIRNNTSQIDISKLSEGIYFMKISSDKGTITKKIVKN